MSALIVTVKEKLSKMSEDEEGDGGINTFTQHNALPPPVNTFTAIFGSAVIL